MKSLTFVVLIAINLLLSPGLFAQNFWQHTDAPEGGMAVSLIEADNGDILLGTTEGTFRSADIGANWTLSENGMSSHYNTDLFKHSNGDIYAAGFDRLYGESRVHRSTDNGQSWTEIPGVPAILDPASDPQQWVVVNSSGNLFVGGSSVAPDYRIARSTDNGNNWTVVLSFDLFSFSIITDLEISSNDNIFVGVTGGSSEGLHLSGDNGNSWSNVYSDKVDKIFIDVNNDIYIISGNNVLISTDNGGNWTEIYNSGSLPAFFDNPSTVMVNANGDIFIGTDIGAGGEGIGRSTDGGTTWTFINNGLPGSTGLFNFPSVNVLFNHSDGQLLCGFSSFNSKLSTDGGIGGVYTSSDNGNNWMESNRGLLAVSFSKVMVHSIGDVFAYSSGGHLLHSSDDGTTWSDRSPLAGTMAPAENPANGDIFVGGAGTLQHSTDLGNTWTEYGGGYFSSHIVSGISINSSGDIFVASSAGINRSTDAGGTWILVWTGNVQDVFIAPNGYVYILSLIPGGLYRSADNGDNWTQLTNGISGTFVLVLAIAQDNTLYAVDGNGIFRSDDLGDSWVLADNGIPKGSNGSYIFTVYAMETNSAGHIFVGTKYLDTQDAAHYDIFRSLNKGNNWSNLSNGIIGDYSIVNDISIGTDNFAYIAATNGVYRSEFATGIIKEEKIPTPHSFILEQNYPNPFNPSTKIKFSVPQTSYISIKIYDVLGNEITTLVNEELQTGSYQVKFDGSNLSSGVYFYTLKAKKFLNTKKLVLMK